MREQCERVSPDGCGNLGYVYEHGAGVPADAVEASRLYEKACDAGNPAACANLGILYEQGRGVGQDFATAARLYQKACNRDDGAGCMHYGLLHEKGLGVKKADEKRALELYRWGCDRGSAESCSIMKAALDRQREQEEARKKPGAAPLRAPKR